MATISIPDIPLAAPMSPMQGFQTGLGNMQALIQAAYAPQQARAEINMKNAMADMYSGKSAYYDAGGNLKSVQANNQSQGYGGSTGQAFLMAKQVMADPNASSEQKQAAQAYMQRSALFGNNINTTTPVGAGFVAGQLQNQQNTNPAASPFTALGTSPKDAYAQQQAQYNAKTAQTQAKANFAGSAYGYPAGFGVGSNIPAQGMSQGQPQALNNVPANMTPQGNPSLQAGLDSLSNTMQNMRGQTQNVGQAPGVNEKNFLSGNMQLTQQNEPAIMKPDNIVKQLQSSTLLGNRLDNMYNILNKGKVNSMVGPTIGMAGADRLFNNLSNRAGMGNNALSDFKTLEDQNKFVSENVTNLIMPGTRAYSAIKNNQEILDPTNKNTNAATLKTNILGMAVMHAQDLMDVANGQYPYNIRSNAVDQLNKLSKMPVYRDAMTSYLGGHLPISASQSSDQPQQSVPQAANSAAPVVRKYIPGKGLQ